MSDLQCPATVLLIAHASLVSSRPACLESRQLSGVFIASAVAAEPEALAAAAGLAGDRGCRLSSLAGAEDGAALARAMEDLADLHRGETIAIVATREMIQHALATAEPPADVVTVDIDSSGWSVRPA